MTDRSSRALRRSPHAVQPTRGRSLVTGSYCLLLSIVLAVHVNAQADQPGPILVFGELRTGDGSPIAGKVELIPALTNHAAADLFDRSARGRAVRALATAHSNAGGAFELTAPSPGVYWIQAHAPGYASVQRNLRFLGTSRKLAPLRLPAAQTEIFRIEDQEGNPIQGATIRVALSRDRSKPSDAATSAVGTSDAGGRVELQLADGDRTAQIDVVADGFVPGANRNISAEALRSDWSTVTLIRGQARTVRVTVDGKPYENAVILLQGGRLAVSRTSPDGQATVWVPPNATAETPMPMVAEGDGLHSHFTVAHRKGSREPDEGALALDVAVPADTQTVRGVVIDADGDPVSGAWVWPTWPFGDPRRTDERGRFVLALGSEYPTDDHRTQIGVGLPGADVVFVDLGQHDEIIIERPRGGVRFRVTDTDGNPVEGVRIVAAPNPSQVERARRPARMGQPITVTDRQGHAQLHLPVSEIAYRLAVRKDGYQHWDDDLPTASPEQTGPRQIDIVLEQGTVQVGWVVDQDDFPIADATVEVHLPDSRAMHFVRFASDASASRLAEASTNEEGRFELRDLPPQRVRLEARAGGFAPTEVEGVELLETSGELGTLVLSPGHVLEGTVVDDLGEPFPGVGIQIRRQRNRIFASSSDEPLVESDAEGRFAQLDLAAGTYQLSIQRDGYRRIDEQIEIPREDPIVLRLIRGMTLPVRVTDAEGNAPEFAIISWHDKNPTPRNGRYDVISGYTRLTQGTGEMYGLKAGTFSVNVDPGNGPAFDFDLTLDERGRARADHEQVVTDGHRLDISFLDGVTVSGTVRGPDGEIVTDLIIERGQHTSRSNGGEYTLSGVEPGPLEVTFRSSELAPHTARIEVGTSDITYDVTLDEGWTLQGTVLDRDTATPISAAQIQLIAANAAFPGMQEGQTAISDTSGRFAIPGITEGQFQALVHADGYAQTSSELLTFDGPPAPLELELSRGARLFGVVTQAGEPVDGAQISIVFSQTSSFYSTTGFDGRYELEHMPRGLARITATRETARSSLVSVQVPERGEIEQDIELGASRLTGTVLREGVPYPDAMITALGVGGSAFGGPNSTTDAEGRFVLDGLSDGTYEVLVQTGNSAFATARKTVEVLGETRVDFLIGVQRLAGQVVSTDGTPVNGASVVATASNVSSPLEARGARAVSGENGDFLLELPTDADRFEIFATATGHGPGRATWSRGQSPQLELRLAASAGTLEIRWSGRAPESASLHLTDAAGRVAKTGFGSTYQGWELRDVPPGDWILSATSGLVVASTRVVVPPDAGDPSPIPVELNMPPSGLVRLASARFTLDWSGRSTIRLLDAKGREIRLPGSDSVIRSLQTFSQMVFGGAVAAPVGTWTIEQIANGNVTARATFQVEPDRLTEIEFDP